MNIKRYLYIGIGVFLFIVFLAVCITAEFKLSYITRDAYAFIETFFNRWSPALAAAGTLIVAILAIAAIYEARRTQSITKFEERLSKVEEWTRDSMPMLLRMRVILLMAEHMSEKEKTLKREHKKLEYEATKLKNQWHELENQKQEGNGELISRLEDIKRRLEENAQKRVKINEELIKNNEELVEYLKKSIDELVTTSGQLTYSERVVKPVIRSIRDSELEAYLNTYYGLTSQLGKKINKGDAAKAIKLISCMEDTISNMLERVSHLRDAIMS